MRKGSQVSLNAFRILMATRRVPINPDHVTSLNLIEVDFYKCGAVEGAWKAYKSHLSREAVQNEAWHEEKEKLLATLLLEIARVLDFDIPVLDIFKGGYAPSGWSYRDRIYTETLEYFSELRAGKKIMPVWIEGTTDRKLGDEKE